MSLLYIEHKDGNYWRAQCDVAACSAYLVSGDRQAAKDWDLNHWKEFHGYPVAMP